MSDGKILPLSAKQLAVIEDLGSLGYYPAMYRYIADQMSEGLIPGSTQDQLFWFREAAAVNADEVSSTAAFFIRDMARLGLGLSSISDPAIQADSNELAANVFEQIKNDSGIPDFSVQLNDDIGIALTDAGLTLGEWGGSFYFWNSAYTDPTTGVQTTVGQYILANSSERSAFVANTAQAIADTLQNFSPSLSNLSAGLQAFKAGFSNLVLGGIQSAIVAFEIYDRVWLDLPEAAAEPLLQMLEGGGTGNGLYAAAGSESLAAGDGTDILFGGQELGSVGNDTLVGGAGSDVFVFSLPTSGSATETIDDADGSGQIALLADGQATMLGGAGSPPLAAVQGQSDTWEDSSGALYAYDPITQDLTISGGELGSGNQIVVDDFNISAATEIAGSSVGDLGLQFADQIDLVVGSTDGSASPATDFMAGGAQSYTVSVDAPSSSGQLVTITLGGAPAADFGLVSGTSIIPINSDGTFTVTIPAGQTSAAFSLVNTGDVGSNANLSFTASIQNPSDPAAQEISSSPLTQSYVESQQDPFAAPVASQLYYSGTDVLGDGEYSDTPYSGSSPVGSIANGNAFITLDGPGGESINGGTGSDTLYGGPAGQGGVVGQVSVINGNGGHDIIDLIGPAPVQIYGNSAEDLAQAVVDAESGTATHQQGDLISSEIASATMVGGDGDNLLLSGSNGVIVAGPGNDTIVGGGYVSGGDGLENDSWSANVSENQLNIMGEDLSFQTAAESNLYGANYEGNVDSFDHALGNASDTIFGGAGNDVILLSNGSDDVNLGTGDSTVLGGMGSDTISGGSGNDSILGGGGSDYLAAGSGNDLIVGRGGNNTIFGGSGTDTMFAGGQDSNWTTEETGSNYVQAGSGNSLIYGSGGNDTLIGGAGTDTLQAGNGNESIVAGSGDTSVNGGNGVDTIVAGSGSDTIWGSTASTTVYGGAGTDWISGSGGTDVIYAGDGGTAQAATTVIAGSGDTTIYGGQGVDSIAGGSGSDVIYAGDGGTSSAATQVVAGSGDTTIYGGDGVDNILGGSGTDVLYAGDGGEDGSPSCVTAGTGTATLYGGAGVSVLNDSANGTDLLEAGSGETTLVGVGQDTLMAGSGADYLTGGPGCTYVFDSNAGVDEVADNGGGTVEFTSTVDPNAVALSAVLGAGGQGSLTVDEGDGSVTLDGALSGASLDSVEFDDPESWSLTQFIQQEASLGNVTTSTLEGLSGTFTFDVATGDSLIGGSGLDTISAWGNNDTLSAGLGGTTIIAGGTDDSVTGGSGNDTLDALSAGITVIGGTGNQVFEINDPTDVVQAQANASSNEILSSVSYTLPTNVDVLTLTGTGNLSATGNDDAANILTGNSGDDTLTAGSGSDILVSGSGVDTLVGGTGRDTFVVNNSADVVEPAAYSGGRDTIESSVSYDLTVPIGALSLTGSDDLYVTDDYGYATITGNAGSDTLVGGSGADTLVAGAGVATLVAGSGNNTFVINNVKDFIQTDSTAGNDTVESSVNDTLGAGLDTLEFTGSAALQGQGNADATNLIKAGSGNDTLIAGSGSDTLVAGSGNDTLVAGSGTDLLKGATGSTTYLFDSGFTRVEIQPGVGSGTIEFGSGVTPSDLAVGLTTDSTGTPALLIEDGTGSVTVDGGLTGSISTFDFADGTELTLAGLLTAATVTPGSIAGASGNTILDNSTAASLSGGSGQDTILGTGASDTLTAGQVSQYLLGAGNADSIIGGYGDDTLVGGGTDDTVLAGNGNQVLYGSGAGDVLVGGIGDDTLYGGTGSDTLRAGTGNTVVYGGQGSDTLALTAGGTVTFYPSGTGGVELIELPVGTTLSGFTSYKGTDGDLILQALSGGSTAVIKGFYDGGSSRKVWLITDSTGNVQTLSGWIDSQSPPPTSSYQDEIDELRQAFAANLTGVLNQIGQQGGTIVHPANTETVSQYYQYQFDGVSTENLIVQGGVANIGSSDDDQRTTTSFQSGSTTYAVTVPVYSEVTTPGETTFIPDSSMDSTTLQETQDEVGGGLYENGYSIVPATDASGKPGYQITELPSTEYEQTGTKTVVETVPEYTSSTQEAQSFTAYNVTGDGGNDLITTGPTTYNQYGQDDGPYFVGTVDSGNGNVSINLGMNNWYEPLGDSGTWTGTLSPGAFIEAGNGNDTIVGTGGADGIAAGTGFDSIEAAFGSTVYVPLQGASTEQIDVVGPYYGYGPLPPSTLVLPTGITPQDLAYRLFSGASGATDQYGNPQETLQIRYGNSSVLIDFTASAPFASEYLQHASTDDINGIDTFQFSDGTVLTRDQVLAMAGAAVSASTLKPAVTALNPAVEAGSAIAGSSLFSGSDSSGLPITWYQVSNTGTNGAYFELNGAEQTPGQSFYVSVDQLQDLTYVPGAAGTSDSVQVSAFDGVVWGATSSFNVEATSSLYEASGPNQEVIGGSTGVDTLVGGYGGDTLVGGSGQDTFDYNAGGGAEAISETVPTSATSDNVIKFGGGITPSSLTLSAGGDPVMVLSTGGSGDSVSIEGFNPLNPLQSFPVQSFMFSDGTSFTPLQLLSDSAVTGSSGSIVNADGSVTYYDFTPSGQQIYYAQNVSSSGQVTFNVSLNSEGFESTNSYAYNSDGTYSDTVVSTPTGGGGSTTTVEVFSASGNLLSQQITNPDGSSSSQTWNPQGQTLTYDVTNADGSTSDSTYSWNADGSYTDTIVATPAGGGGATTTVEGFSASGNLLSQQITNPDGSMSSQTWNAQEQTLTYDVTNADGSTSDSTYSWNADGSHTDRIVATPAGGGGSTTTVEGFNASGCLLSQQITNPDGSSSTQTWNAEGQTLTYDVTSAGGSTSDSTYGWNADGSYTDTNVATPAGGGGSTTTVEGFNASGDLLSQQISNPDGSSSTQTWNAEGQTLTYDVTSAGGSTRDSTYGWNADGSYTDTIVTAPAGGGASTTTVEGFNASGNLLSQDITNPDRSSSTQTWDAQGQTLTYDVTNADGSTSDSSYLWNADGSYTDTIVATPAGGGGSTTTVEGFNASGDLLSQQITNPNGSSSSQTWNTEGQTLTYDVTNAGGSTSDSTYAWSADGTYTDTIVATPAGGEGSTTTVEGFNAAGNLLSQQITNPDGLSSSQTWNAQGRTLTYDVTNADGSTSDSTYAWNTDGSYTDTTVATPAGGGGSTTTVDAFDASGNLLSQNTYAPSSNGAYTDSWLQADGSYGTYWWNTSTSTYEDTWHDSNGSSWTDEYQYASGGAPGASGYSFLETYTASDGSQGTRQYDASTGAITLSWDSASSGQLSGTITDSGFIGLQNEGELTNTQQDLTFFNPSVSPSFSAFLAAH